MKKVILMIMLAAVSSGCTWVSPTDDGLNVRLAYLSQVSACRQLGRITVSVLDKVGFMSRSAERVSQELEILGRNAAAEMAADTMVAMSRVIDGEQTFNVYRCK